jgi:antitoxin component YwqK of YwqJK toxin-antitoxin module
MKFFIKFLLMMIFSFNSIANSIDEFLENNYVCERSPDVINNDGLLYLKTEDRPFSGESICYLNRGHFVNGKKDGRWIYWNNKGLKISISDYSNGKKIGGINLDYFYHNHNQISNIFSYKGEKFNYLTNRDGRQVSYYSNGELRYDTIFKNGLANGKWTGWYENGEIAHELNYKNDKLDGLQKKWNEKGNLSYTAIYRNGSCFSGDCEE